MLYKIAPFIIVIVTTWIISVTIIQLLKYRLQKKIVESGLADEKLINAILKEVKDPKEKQHSLLKWIFITAFGGIGLIFQEFLPYKMNDSMLPYGVICVFLSIGLLFYYLLNVYLLKNKDDQSAA